MATVWELSRFVPAQAKQSTRQQDLKGTFEDDAKGAFADLPSDAIMDANDV